MVAAIRRELRLAQALLEMGQRLLLLFQAGEFVGLEIELIQLLDLIAQQLALGLTLLVVLAAFAILPAQRMPLAMQVAKLGDALITGTLRPDVDAETGRRAPRACSPRAPRPGRRHPGLGRRFAAPPAGHRSRRRHCALLAR